MALGAVHEDPHAVLRQQQGGEQEPGKLAALSGVGRPVDIDLRHGLRRDEFPPRGAHETGYLAGTFLLDP